MSKIQAEVLKATDTSTKRGEDRQEFLARVMKAISALEDKEWEALSQEAQDWFNDAADAKNAKAKQLPDFPDLEPETKDEEEKTKSRRAAAKEEAEPTKPAKPKVKDVVKIVTKRGKDFSGTIVEIDDEVVVLKYGNGDEEEFARSRIESIEIAGAKAKSQEPDEPTIDVGVTVTLVTKRGKEVTGKIIEIDEEVVVLDVDGKDEEFARDRVESIKPVKKASKPAPADDEEEKPKTRRGAAKEEESDAKDEKPKRSSNAAGVSVGTRIKELIAEDFDATEEDIGKSLKKEGIEFRDNTLKLQFTDCHKFIDILKKMKKIK